jgi:hypothetical protein
VRLYNRDWREGARSVAMGKKACWMHDLDSADVSRRFKVSGSLSCTYAGK